MNTQKHTTLTSSTFMTPLGQMIAIANECTLYLLEFVDGRGVDKEIEKLQIATNSTITAGSTPAIQSIKTELALYFNGALKEFKTPIHILGTPFQKSVWSALQQIPYGHTRSYAQQANVVSNKSACRAVGTANGANQLAIIIPCHRIINSNGKLGGYAGGLDRKQWLLALERQNYDK